MLIPILTKNAPQPIGPYSQAIKIGKLLILSGQIPINLESGKIEKDIIKQTKTTLNNILSIVKSSGFKIENIAKTTIFLTDINQLEIVNTVYEKFFLKHKITTFPARSCVQVSALPKNVKIEIEALAISN
ncbi:Rid family detoxifying hydrolase [Buchnera aphidicola]|uniref:Rid family detoxifying hydrolase n=1 Tax=Buchnera aphidicola TaxID=9 RepID=UPI00346412CA